MKMTQTEFAEKLGYSVISIKKWEAADAKPGKKAVDRLRGLVELVTSNGVVLSGVDSSFVTHHAGKESGGRDMTDIFSLKKRGVLQRRVALRQAAMNRKRTLCEVLKESGVSQAQFAKLAGLSPSTVSRIESLRIGTIKAIDKALG